MNNAQAHGLTEDDWTIDALQTSSATFDHVSDNDYPAQRRKLLEALNYLTKLEDDWNASGAKKPSPRAITMTKHFVEYLLLIKKHADFIEPDGDGGIVLRWQTPTQRILLTIDGICLHLSIKENGAETVFVDDISFFDVKNTILPQDVLSYIPQISIG